MPDPHIRAAFYLSPTLDALWRWSDSAEVLTWPDDSTIAFRGEVEAVLGRLAPGGLPPFGAVALLLAACREGWFTSRGRETIAGYARAFGGMHTSVAGNMPEDGQRAGEQLVFGWLSGDIGRLLEGLDAVNRLPRELRDGVDAKALLAETVFEAAKNRSTPEDAQLVVQALNEGVNPETLRPQLCNEEALAQFAKQVDGLHAGLERVDAETLARRAKTGLDEPVEPPDDDLSPPERVRRLLAGLREDPELSGLAKLAQDLMAAVSVPRTLRAREELPVGGVSDLSNRGPLDRLLVSELAHDDLTLAVRVAVNEALYLRRESPPREPPHRRAILIDAGVRMWGVPRVFATAAALALAATNDPKARLVAYRATPHGVAPVDLTARRGLEAHLAALEAAPHPGASLAAFFDALNAEGEEPTDAVVITHADAFNDPAFLNAARALGEPAMYVATVARDGAFSLSAFTRAGKKPVRQAKLSLDAVLGQTPPAKRTTAVPLLVPGRNPSLPAILYADPFPLRLPHVADPKHCAVSKEHGLAAATQDGRLLHWADGRYGGRQLTSLLPSGTVRLVRFDGPAARAQVFITHRREPATYVVTADLAGGRSALVRVELRDPDPKGLFVHAGLLYLVYGKRVDAFDAADGRPVASLPLPEGTKWVRERFFQDHSQHYVIAHQGAAVLKLEPAPLAGDARVLFDREGHDGPLGVLIDGRIADSAGHQHGGFVFSGPGWNPVGISPDGHRLAFKLATGHHVFNLEDGQLGRIGNNVSEELLAPQIYWSTRQAVVARNKFRGAFSAPGLKLTLLTPRGGEVTIGLGKDGHLLLEEGGRRKGPPDGLRPFVETRRSPVARFKMHVATWDDGSKAFLDTRGLLHLKSSDRTVPECSFALSNIAPAAWSSDGKVCGPPFFIGDATPTEGSYFMHLIRCFVARLR